MVIIDGRRAMELAQAAGMQADREDGNFEAARFWLDFARELREDVQFRKMAVVPVRGWTDLTTEEREPSAAGDRTEVLRPGSAVAADGECVHCGYAIRDLYAQTPGMVPLYVHTRTDGAMCPAENTDSWMKSRTHAEPK